MSRSYRRHAKICYGYFGDPVPKKKLTSKIPVRYETDRYDLEDYDDQLMGTNKGAYKKVQGRRIKQITCVQYTTFPKGHYKNHRGPWKSVDSEIISAYILAGK